MCFKVQITEIFSLNWHGIIVIQPLVDSIAHDSNSLRHIFFRQAFWREHCWDLVADNFFLSESQTPDHLTIGNRMSYFDICWHPFCKQENLITFQKQRWFVLNMSSGCKISRFSEATLLSFCLRRVPSRGAHLSLWLRSNNNDSFNPGQIGRWGREMSLGNLSWWKIIFWADNSQHGVWFICGWFYWCFPDCFLGGMEW